MPPTKQTPQGYRAQAQAELAAARALHEKAEAEGRDLTAEETTEFNARVAKSKALQETAVARAARDDQMAAIRAQLAEQDAVEAAAAAVSSDDDDAAGGGILSALSPSGHRKPFAEARDRKAERRGGFSHLGQFALAIRDAMDPAVNQYDNRLRPFAAAQGANIGVGSEGGFLLPPEFSAQIWDGLATDPLSLLAMTDSYPVTGDSLTFNALNETSRATGSRFGGVQARWLDEAQQATPSQPKWRQLTVKPKKLAVLIYATEEMMRNVAALPTFLQRYAGSEIDFMTGDAIINGNGAGKPLGIMGHAATVSVAKETSQATATIVLQNIAKMRARLHPRSWANAVWLANPDVFPQLDMLTQVTKNAAGAENVGPSVGVNSFFNPSTLTLLGRPVIPCEYCQTLGTQGDLILADLKGYVTGTRGGVDSAMSIHLRFDYAENVFRFLFYVDGQPWLASALTPFKGTATLSTFVVLDNRP